MVVGICDNDKLWCKRAEELIKKYAESKKEKIKIITFYSILKLIKYTGEPMDLIFMETVFETDQENGIKKNGIWLGQFVNKKWNHCQIVYLSHHKEYVTDVYRTNHIFFVLKDQFQRWIPYIFEKVLRNLEKTKEKYFFSAIGGKQFSVKIEDIRYFERSNRVTKVGTVWGTYEIWDKIKDIYDYISKADFLRCHNSYIISFTAIREIAYDKIILDDGKVIPISRSYRKSVREEFTKWELTLNKQ